MRKTGIYKITNLSNGKFYIGQSRDILTRWKAHTQSLSENSNESVIRTAFAKYDLRIQVSEPGVHGNFNFEILEICPEADLFEIEKRYIQELKPEYNVQLMGVNPNFQKRDTQKSQYFIQYHSVEKMGYIPGASDDDSITTANSNYGIFTKKRVATNMLGSSVVIILGGKPKNCKYNRYYLWSEMIVEDVQFDADNKTYLVYGIENHLNEPLDITDIEGFDHFRMQCGNFAYGLQSMKNKPFYHETILPFVSNNKIKHVMSYNKWIDNFIEREERLYELRSNS
ncbi:MAG: GIY-YIG nuclease family protein [Thermoguttaceae bacterium]